MTVTREHSPYWQGSQYLMTSLQFNWIGFDQFHWFLFNTGILTILGSITLKTSLQFYWIGLTSFDSINSLHTNKLETSHSLLLPLTVSVLWCNVSNLSRNFVDVRAERVERDRSHEAIVCHLVKKWHNFNCLQFKSSTNLIKYLPLNVP